MKHVGKVLEWIGFWIIVITDVLWINDSVLGVVCGIHILASLLIKARTLVTSVMRGSKKKKLKRKDTISGKKQFIYG